MVVGRGKQGRAGQGTFISHRQGSSPWRTAVDLSAREYVLLDIGPKRASKGNRLLLLHTSDRKMGPKRPIRKGEGTLLCFVQVRVNMQFPR